MKATASFTASFALVAVEDRLTSLAVQDGNVVPTRRETARYPLYEREVRESRHGFVLYGSLVIQRLSTRSSSGSAAGSFGIFAPPATS
jgi:hypothetical protein